MRRKNVVGMKNCLQNIEGRLASIMHFYRKLNVLTIIDSYPIPLMDECINEIGDAMKFKMLNETFGYWQV